MKNVLIVIMLFLFPFGMFSQADKALILGFGPNKMSGDIGGDNFTSLLKNDLGLGVSLGFRYVFPFNLGVRVFGGYDQYKGEDKHDYNGGRGLFFNSKASSIGLQFEYVVWGNSYIEKTFPHSIYLFSGAKGIFSNALLNDSEKIDTNTVGLFAGIGYQYRFSDYFGAGIELRQTQFLSDRVDGYFPDLPSNKSQDTAFDVKFTLSYFIPWESATGGKWDLY